MTARTSPTAALAGLLALLSLAAPLVNAAAGPPRALFVALAPDAPEPTLSLSVARAPDGAWLLTIKAENFRFTDLCRADAPAAPIGHAHVFAGETRIASAFGPVVDLGPLSPGRHRLRVMLRAQDHRVLVSRAGVIAAEITFVVSKDRIPTIR